MTATKCLIRSPGGMNQLCCPNPSDYPKLQIMAAPRNPDNTPAIIRKLMVTKGRLEIMMDNLDCDTICLTYELRVWYRIIG